MAWRRSSPTLLRIDLAHPAAGRWPPAHHLALLKAEHLSGKWGFPSEITPARSRINAIRTGHSPSQTGRHLLSLPLPLLIAFQALESSGPWEWRATRGGWCSVRAQLGRSHHREADLPLRPQPYELGRESGHVRAGPGSQRSRRLPRYAVASTSRGAAGSSAAEPQRRRMRRGTPFGEASDHLAAPAWN